MAYCISSRPVSDYQPQLELSHQTHELDPGPQHQWSIRGLNPAASFPACKNMGQQRQYALIIFGQFDLGHPPGSKSQQRRLYESARCVTKIYQGLQAKKISPKDVTLLMDKPSIDIFNKFSNHTDSEVTAFAKIKPDGLPTHSDIQSCLMRLRWVANNGDSIWIFLVGHGSKPGFCLFKGEGFLSRLTCNEMQGYLEKKPSGVHYNVIVDCCHSGYFLPLTSPQITVMTSCHFQECSVSEPIDAKRYVTSLVSAFETEPSKTLLESHLSALDSDSTGYDSLSFYLDSHCRQLSHTDKDQVSPDHLVALDCPRNEGPDKEEGMLIHSYRTSDQIEGDLDVVTEEDEVVLGMEGQNKRIREEMIDKARDASKRFCRGHWEKRYHYLEHKIDHFLKEAEPHEINEFAHIAEALIG